MYMLGNKFERQKTKILNKLRKFSTGKINNTGRRANDKNWSKYAVKVF